MPTGTGNILYYGDNLDVLRRYVADESVELVYLDPPFNSTRDYNVLYAEKDGTAAAAQIQAFEDTWEWNTGAMAAFDEVVAGGGRLSEIMQGFRKAIGDTDMLAYLSMMASRLAELRRVLKPTGSLYLHCDPTASHYLKLLLDAVFGANLFRSEVIWKRSSAHGGSQKWGPVHDTLLFYTKTDTYTWNTIYQPLPQETVDAWYNNFEEGTGRRFHRADLTAAGVRSGSSGKAWRGIDPTAKGRHWAIPGFARDIIGDKDTQDALDALDAGGRIHRPKRTGGMPRLKRYLDESKGIPAVDVITDVSPLNNVDSERLGYPTQKPVALLERIIRASSNEGDVVLDPFCGCGTTIQAAQKLGRRWLGIDITHLAVGLIKHRLLDAFGAKPKIDYEVIGEPTDLAGARQLAADNDRHQFEHWALGLVGARSSAHGRGADRGIDGVLTYQEGSAGSDHKRVLISVKSGKVSSPHVRDLRGTVEREKAAIGALLTLEEPTRDMRAEAASAGFHESAWGKHPRLQILAIADLLDGKAIDMPPIRPGGTTFKRAPRERPKAPEPLDLFAVPMAAEPGAAYGTEPAEPAGPAPKARGKRGQARARRKP